MFPDPRGAIPLGGKEMRETDAKSTLEIHTVGQMDVSEVIHEAFSNTKRRYCWSDLGGTFQSSYPRIGPFQERARDHTGVLQEDLTWHLVALCTPYQP